MVQPTPLLSDARRRKLIQLAQRRRRGRAGFGVDMNKSATFASGVIGTTTHFPDRAGPVAFRASIEIEDNGGTHTGLIFEFGGTSRAIAAWIEDDKIGFRAGGAAASADVALAAYDAGTELEVGRRFDLLFFANPGTGDVLVWDHGIELARATASGGSFGGDWAGSGGGAFGAGLSGTVPADVVNTGVPVGFSIVSTLETFVNQIPGAFTP